MLKHALNALLPAAAAFSVASPAFAAHIQVFGSESSVSVSAHTTYVNDSAAGTKIINGVVDPAFLQSEGTVSTSHSADGWTNSASASQTAGAHAEGTSELSSGSLHAYAQTSILGPLTGANFSGSFVHSVFSDTVYFTNTTNDAIALDVFLAMDGFLDGPPGFNSGFGGYGNLGLSGCGACGNAQNQAISYLGGPVVGSSVNVMFSGNGVYNINDFGNLLGDYWTATTEWDESTGELRALLTSKILIPVGETSLGIRSILDLDCRGDNVICDFGHTSSFQFGPLADGLSFTSQSGVFNAVRQPDVDPSEVPIPGAVFLFAPALALFGRIARRRA
ncbi:MAG: hypothetical protein R3C58_01750 [Parvularculaceae bacterium]